MAEPRYKSKTTSVDNVTYCASSDLYSRAEGTKTVKQDRQVEKVTEVKEKSSKETLSTLPPHLLPES